MAGERAEADRRRAKAAKPRAPNAANAPDDADYNYVPMPEDTQELGEDGLIGARFWAKINAKPPPSHASAWMEKKFLAILAHRVTSHFSHWPIEEGDPLKMAQCQMCSIVRHRREP